MELFIVIVIVGIAVIYVINNFYSKYKIGKSSGSSCGCSSCGLKDTACGQPTKAKHDDFSKCESSIINDL